MLRRRSRARRRGVATAAVLAVGSTGLAFWLAGSSSHEPGTPVEAVQQYVDAIVRDDPEAAWRLMCESQQQESGPKARFLSENGRPRFLAEGRRIALEPVPFEPFPIEAWRVGYYREGDAGQTAQALVIRENGNWRVCGDPRYLFEDRAGIP